MNRESPDYGYKDAIAAMEAAMAADPRRFSFGMYAGDSFVGGAAAFQWYASADDLFASIAYDLHFLIDEDGDGEVVRSVVEILQAYRGNDRFGSECFGKLRAALEGVQDLHWVGTFDHLVNGDCEFARGARMEFRSCVSEQLDESDADDGPLAADEIDGFIAWSRERGH